MKRTVTPMARAGCGEGRGGDCAVDITAAGSRPSSMGIPHPVQSRIGRCDRAALVQVRRSVSDWSGWCALISYSLHIVSHNPHPSLHI